MRKRTQNHLFDNIMWYLIYLLPLICLVLAFASGVTDLTISGLMSQLGLQVLTDNVIYTNLVGIFGTGGVFPLFDNLEILSYLTYFISVFIIHLFVDFLLFIPRLAHKWMRKISGGDD